MSANIVVSAGDVLQLCQQTWKLHHTFKSDKPGVPIEFGDVEVALQGLTRALSAVSESLDEDQSLLQTSNVASKKAVILIMESYQRTLHELEIFVASYQDVRKVSRPDGSRMIERQWRPIFLRNYLTTIWTNEGGDINDLRTILTMHTKSIVLFHEALTSRDLKLLEFILPPVAQEVQQIHAPYRGTGKVKLLEVENNMESLATQFRVYSGSNAQLKMPAPIQYGANTSAKRAGGDASRQWLPDTKPDLPPLVPPRSPERAIPHHIAGLTVSRPTTADTITTAMFSTSGRDDLSVSPTTRLPDLRTRSDTVTSAGSYARSQTYDDRSRLGVVDSISHNLAQIELASSSRTRTPRAISSEGSFTATVLPTAATSVTSPHAEDPFHQIRLLGKTPPGEESSSGNSSAADAHKLWRDALFRHSAVLYENRCLSVEYTKPNEKRYGDFLLETASGPCNIYLITKGEKSASGTLRYHTSVWILSDDGETVMEQRLPDDIEVIPYTIWDNLTKIVLRDPVKLKFFGKHPDDRVGMRDTSWVNYLFADEPSATEFQNVLLGKKLLASIRTRKTTRLTGVFSNQQQLCALENLRIVRDDNTGLIYGMIHFVPEFATGSGYMTFALNDVKNPIRVKEDSATAIKMKGMHIGIREGTRRPSTSSDPTRAMKKGQDVLITGAKLEFYNKDDKAKFMLKLKEIQDSGHLAGD